MREWLARLGRTLSPASREDSAGAEEQRLSAARGATPVRDIKPRDEVRVCGVIRSITYPAPGSGGSFKARLWDGTGTIELVGLGRKVVDGMTAGVHLVAHGVAARRADGLCLYNPSYDIIAS